jgi:hypothetical protein
MTAAIARSIAISAALLSTNAWSNDIDLSTRTDPAGSFQIGFCARPSPDSVKGWPGHAFVSFSRQKPTGEIEFTAIGHTVTAGVSPAQAAWSLFGPPSGPPVSGVLKEELYLYSAALQNCLLVKVDREDYERAFELSKSPLQKLSLVRDAGLVLEAYKLGSEDCVNWMTSVAMTLRRKGIVVPARGAADIPMGYMQKFIAANSLHK